MSRFAVVCKKVIVRLLGDEKKQAYTIPLFAIFLSLLTGCILLWLLGKNPFVAYYSLMQGSGIAPKLSYAAYKGVFSDFSSLLNAWTPMLFASLSVAVALRTGLFNIGVSGQMLAAGFIATVLVGYSSLSAGLAMPAVILVGLLTGAAVGGLIGFLKYRFNINEVVSSIMINYIIQYVVSFFINTQFVDPLSRQSVAISSASRLTLMDVVVGNLKMDIPTGIVLAIATAFFMRFLLGKTVMGFELKTVGSSRTAAEYAGINVGRNMVLAMVISGGLAGLAGVTNYLGYFASIQPRVLPAMGFDAIAVAILGNSNPIGIIFSSFLITVISKGSAYMSSTTGTEAEIASVITSLILLYSACNIFIRYSVQKAKDSLAGQISTKAV